MTIFSREKWILYGRANVAKSRVEQFNSLELSQLALIVRAQPLAHK